MGFFRKKKGRSRDRPATPEIPERSVNDRNYGGRNHSDPAGDRLSDAELDFAVGGVDSGSTLWLYGDS